MRLVLKKLKPSPVPKPSAAPRLKVGHTIIGTYVRRAVSRTANGKRQEVVYVDTKDGRVRVPGAHITELGVLKPGDPIRLEHQGALFTVTKRVVLKHVTTRREEPEVEPEPLEYTTSHVCGHFRRVWRGKGRTELARVRIAPFKRSVPSRRR